jgi:hypothetical protein
VLLASQDSGLHDHGMCLSAPWRIRKSLSLFQTRGSVACLRLAPRHDELQRGFGIAQPDFLTD